MSKRNWIGFSLTLISIGLLIPGLFLDVLTIKIEPLLPLVGKLKLFEETRSIIGTMNNLYETGNALVGNLILLFSIIIPVLKALLLLTALFWKSLTIREQIVRFVSTIGKWSMADVFIVGVFVAYLATGSMKGIDAYIESGFYYFLAYCLVSLLGMSFMRIQSEAS